MDDITAKYIGVNFAEVKDNLGAAAKMFNMFSLFQKFFIITFQIKMINYFISLLPDKPKNTFN
jgi:hypothetical protein